MRPAPSAVGEQPVGLVVPDRVRALPAAPPASDVFFRLFLDHVDDIVEGQDTDQAIAVVHHRRGDEVVALNMRRSPPLVVGRAHVRRSLRSARNRTGAWCATAGRAPPPLSCGRHRRRSPKSDRKIGRLAHVVDGLPDRQCGSTAINSVHAPAGRGRRMGQAAGKRRVRARAAARDLGCSSRQSSSRGRVVRSSSRTPGYCFGRQLVKDLLADRIVDLGQRGEVKLAPHQPTEARSQLDRRLGRNRRRRSHRSPTSASTADDQRLDGLTRC